MLLGKGREHRKRRELRNAHDRGEDGVHVLVAEHVLHIVHRKARGSAVAHHEERHGERGPHELVVLEEDGEHLPEAGALLGLEAAAVLLHAEEREALEAQHGDRHGHGHDEPAVRRIAHGRGHGLPGDHDGEHADVGADAGEGAHVLALFLVHGQRGQHRPVGDVVHAVGDVPEYVREAEHDDEPVVREPEVREQYEEEHAARHRADEHGRLVLAPGAVDIVDDEAGDGVVERVEDAQHGEHHARRREHADGQGEDVGEIVQQGVGLEGVEHIPAHGAEAEEVFIALFQLSHALSSPLRRISRLCRG